MSDIYMTGISPSVMKINHETFFKLG